MSNTTSRFERIRAFLDAAAGESRASYQGYGAFWRLPLEVFVTVELYGIAMIAPAEPGSPGSPSGDSPSCCHAATEGGKAASSGRQPGRGARSGLVRGLRGEYPFDGSRFPRLPWGGEAVAATDIQLLESWIDDGCMADEDDAAGAPSIAAGSDEGTARALGHAAHPVWSGPVNDLREQGTKVRKCVDSCTEEELNRLRRALAEMRALDSHFLDERSFGFWARMHANNCQHGWEQFLPWHRLHVYYLEQHLQDFDSTVTMPYWDWSTNYAANVGINTMDGGEIPAAFRCWMTREGLDGLPPVVASSTREKLASVIGQRFNSGLRLFAAAGLRYGEDPASDAAVMSALQRINQLWHRKRWPGGGASVLFEDYPSAADTERILQIDNFAAFGGGPSDDHYFGALENVHNLIHNFTGGLNPTFRKGMDPEGLEEPEFGDMIPPARTANDAIFFALHSNVDRLWAEWQLTHRGQDPLGLSDALPPFALNVQQSLDIASLGYEYAKDCKQFPTDPGRGITRFKSSKAGAAPAAVQSHRRAEIRLHRLQHGRRSGAIRVFVNAPDADASTATQGNDCYAGQVHTFSGSCYGGPQHCNVPPAITRPFDRRGRHRKTPSNFRLDVTDTIARLKAKGDADFHIHLVAVDLTGEPASDVMWLDGVSLYFFD